MTLSAWTLLVEATFAVLLAVTIVYAVKLNDRLSRLRERDSEFGDMIAQFEQASVQAHEAAAILKAAGVDAERQLRTPIERAQALRDDLTYMIEHGERIADRIEKSAPRARTAAAATPKPTGEEPQRSRSDGPDEHGYRSEIEQALAQVIRSTPTAG